LVKLPGQDRPVVDDRPAETIDIVPTIADVLDVEIPWGVDGRSLFAGEGEDRPARLFDWEFNELEPSDGDFAIVDRGAAFDRVLEGVGLGVDAAEPYPLHRVGPYGDLVAVPVEDVAAGPPADFPVRFTGPPTIAYDPATGSAPVYVSGEVDGSRDDWFVVAVNGVIGGIGRLHERGSDTSVWWAMVPEELLREGENEFEASLVDGPAERPILHRLLPEGPG